MQNSKLNQSYAVIFSSQRSTQDSAGYNHAANRMVELARQQPGFLGIESVRQADGLGITISYWKTLEDIQNWKQNSEHLSAQQQGREDWYTNYQVKICKIERQYESKG